MAATNEVTTSTGKRRAVCEWCGTRSQLLAALTLLDMGAGWSCAPYPADHEHRDGSHGTVWSCPACTTRRRQGERLRRRGT